MSEERRKDDRLNVSWRASVTLEDDRSFVARIADVSLAGTLVECAAPVSVGDEVLLSVPSLGEFAGRVQWTRDGAFGLALQAGPQLFLREVAEAPERHPGLETAPDPAGEKDES